MAAANEGSPGSPPRRRWGLGRKLLLQLVLLPLLLLVLEFGARGLACVQGRAYSVPRPAPASRPWPSPWGATCPGRRAPPRRAGTAARAPPTRCTPSTVSYTHLTLPTIYSV